MSNFFGGVRRCRPAIAALRILSRIIPHHPALSRIIPLRRPVGLLPLCRVIAMLSVVSICGLFPSRLIHDHDRPGVQFPQTV